MDFGVHIFNRGENEVYLALLLADSFMPLL